MARKTGKGGSKDAGQKKDKDLERKGSLQKSTEVNEDVFAAEFLKAVKPSAAEEKSADSVFSASGKANAVEKDDAKKKDEKIHEKDLAEGKVVPTGTTGVSELKGDVDNTKGGDKTTGENEAAEDKGAAPGKERDNSGSPPARDKPGTGEEEQVSKPETAEKLEKAFSKGFDKKAEGSADADQGKEKDKQQHDGAKTLLLPTKADELSAAISAAVQSAMPEEVKRAEDKFVEAENVFTEANNRAKELVEQSKEIPKSDVEAKKEADGEAAVATAEAVNAEAAAQEALKGEVRAFLGMGDAAKKASAAEKKASGAAEESKKYDASAEVKEGTPSPEGAENGGAGAAAPGGEKKREEEGAVPASAQAAGDKGEQATAEKSQPSGEANFDDAGGQTQRAKAEEKQSKKEEDGASAASPPVAQIKISPAHLLDYSKRRSSDRDAILAALAVVGLDTPETRRVVAAAEQAAAEAAEQEGAAAAAAKAAAGQQESGEGARSDMRLNAFQKQTLAKLEGNQEYVILLEQRLQEEIAALRDKYDRLMEPVFDERARILFSGADEDDEKQEGKRGTEKGTEDDRKTDKPSDGPLSWKYSENVAELRATAMKNEVGTRALPGFWLQTFSNHKLLSSLIGQRDKPLLLYLQNVRRVFHMEKAEGFSLIFEFGENPFFTPQTLTKTFRMREEGGDWVVAKTEATAIHWEDGMDVTMRVIVRKQLNMRTRDERTVKEYLTEKSFFHFFKNSTVPTDEELAAMPEEEQASLFTVLKTEYDVGVVIRDLLIPHAVDWYLGTATEDLDRTSDESEPETPRPRREKKVPPPLLLLLLPKHHKRTQKKRPPVLPAGSDSKGYIYIYIYIYTYMPCDAAYIRICA